MASTNPTPNQVFVANAVPSGGFFAKIYRPGYDNSGTLVFTQLSASPYRVLSFSPQRDSSVVDRPDIDGGDNGFTVVAGKIEGSITIQLATDGSPTLQPGDCFKTSVVFRDTAGASVAQMIVLTGMSINIDTSARAMSGTGRVNKQATSGGSGYDNLDALSEYGV